MDLTKQCFFEFLAIAGIFHQTTVPYTSKQDNVSENAP